MAFVVWAPATQIVDKVLFDSVQARFAENKRMGSQRARGCDEDGSPRYWLTGKLYCGECGHSMQSTSGTSMTGVTHYYYGCGEHLKQHGCKKRNARKEAVEDLVTQILSCILDDTEMLASLAVDMPAYYKGTYGDGKYLDGLRAELRETEKALRNIVKAVERGAFSELLQARLSELEVRKQALEDAIDAEEARAAIVEEEHGITAYFQRFAHACLDDPVLRREVLDYFVDKIFLYDDKLVITGDFVDYSGSERYKHRRRVGAFEVGFDVDHDVGSGFDRTLEFECFAHGSTMTNQRAAARHSRGPLSCASRRIELCAGRSSYWGWNKRRRQSFHGPATQAHGTIVVDVCSTGDGRRTISLHSYAWYDNPIIK